MNVRKFVAANAREALRLLKETLGPDAIILSNRSVVGGVEIMAVAARDMAMIVPQGAGPQTSPLISCQAQPYRMGITAPHVPPAPAPSPEYPG